MWWIIFFHRNHRFHRIFYINLPQKLMGWIFVRNAVNFWKKCGEMWWNIYFHRIYRNHRISYKNSPHSSHFLQKFTQKPRPGRSQLPPINYNNLKETKCHQFSSIIWSLSLSIFFNICGLNFLMVAITAAEFGILISTLNQENQMYFFLLPPGKCYMHILWMINPFLSHYAKL